MPKRKAASSPAPQGQSPSPGEGQGQGSGKTVKNDINSDGDSDDMFLEEVSRLWL